MTTTATNPLVEADERSRPTQISLPKKVEALLTTKEAAGFLRISKSYLDKLRVYGGGPKFLRFGRKILYRQSELNLWAEQRSFGSTSEYIVGALKQCPL
jgi:excisionase family DNA binding protein